MKLTKQRLKEIIKEEFKALNEEENYGDPRNIAQEQEEKTYVALVNYAADMMRHGLQELGYDVATAETLTSQAVLKMVHQALDEAAEMEL
jgi:hypothetical protein